jgi:hypothetical protein
MITCLVPEFKHVVSGTHSHLSSLLSIVIVFACSLLAELERLNLECEGTINRECSLVAVEARNILKVALASQAAMAREVQKSAGRRKEP